MLQALGGLVMLHSKKTRRDDSIWPQGQRGSSLRLNRHRYLPKQPCPFSAWVLKKLVLVGMICLTIPRTLLPLDRGGQNHFHLWMQRESEQKLGRSALFLPYRGWLVLWSAGPTTVADQPNPGGRVGIWRSENLNGLGLRTWILGDLLSDWFIRCIFRLVRSIWFLKNLQIPTPWEGGPGYLGT